MQHTDKCRILTINISHLEVPIHETARLAALLSTSLMKSCHVYLSIFSTDIVLII